MFGYAVVCAMFMKVPLRIIFNLRRFMNLKKTALAIVMLGLIVIAYFRLKSMQLC